MIHGHQTNSKTVTHRPRRNQRGKGEEDSHAFHGRGVRCHIGVKGVQLMGDRFHKGCVSRVGFHKCRCRRCWVSRMSLSSVLGFTGVGVDGVRSHGCRCRRCWVARVPLSLVFGFTGVVAVHCLRVGLHGCSCRLGWVSRVSLSSVLGFAGGGVADVGLHWCRCRLCWVSLVFLSQVFGFTGVVVAGGELHEGTRKDKEKMPNRQGHERNILEKRTSQKKTRSKKKRRPKRRE